MRTSRFTFWPIVLALVSGFALYGCTATQPDEQQTDRSPIIDGDGPLFSDDFSAGLDQWIETGEGDWNTESLHSSSGYPADASGSPAAHSDTCSSVCAIETAVTFDLSQFDNATLTFLRFVDSKLDSGEYLELQAWSGSGWDTLLHWTNRSGDDNVWHFESVDLSAYMEVTDFRFRFRTMQNRSDEHVQVDDVVLLADAATVCGDGTCESDEDAATCPDDCPAVCGDGACTHAEDVEDCPEDCAVCGDGACTPPEDAESCELDCPAVCGDGVCTHAEECVSCEADCGACGSVCGNGLCEGDEDCTTCDGDCGTCALITIAYDDFEDGWSGVTGWEDASWSYSGDVSIRGGGDSYLQFQGSTGDLSTNISRSAPVTGVTIMTLTFQARVKSFEGGDMAYVEVSIDGGSWFTVHELTSADSDNAWHEHVVDLSSFDGESLIIRFVADMDSRRDELYVDDVILTGLRGYPGCQPLPPPVGEVVRVDPTVDLHDVLATAAPWSTIMLADGTYNISRRVYLQVEGVSLRGESGDRSRVVIDAEPEGVSEALVVTADDVTIADLTIRGASDHGIQVWGFNGDGLDRLLVYNVHFLDAGDQPLKVSTDFSGTMTSDGEVACSHFSYTTHAPSDYTNGVVVHAGLGWVVRDNLFTRIRGPGDGFGGPAILFWTGSTDTVVERNILIDCYRGIAFGDSSHSFPDHLGGVVRNNFLASTIPGDINIEMVNADDFLVAYNTVMAIGTDSSVWAAEARGAATNGLFAYNLTSSYIYADRDGASALQQGNVIDASAGWFVDPANGDLHLTDEAGPAFASGERLAEVATDIDGEARGDCPEDCPEVGADER